MMALVTAAFMTSRQALAASPAAGQAAGQSGGSVKVEIGDAGLNPGTVTVSAGTKVEWDNVSNALSHSIAFSDGLSSPTLTPHQKYERTFSTAGSYTYTASNPSQLGVVQVTGSGTGGGGGGGGGGNHGGHTLADLKVTSSHVEVIAPGAVVTYHVVYENDSDDVTALNAVLTVTLPASSTLAASLHHEGGVFTPTTQLGSTLVYSLGNLPARSEGKLDLQVQFAPSLPQEADETLSAQISAANMSGTASGDGSTTEDHQTVEAPRLTLGIHPVGEHGEDNVFRPGSVITYALEYANHSDQATANSVTITLQLPISVTFVSAHKVDGGGQPTVTNVISGNDVLFYIGGLSPEASGRIYAQLRLSDAFTTGQKLAITGRVDSANGTLTGGGHGADDGRVISDTQSISDDRANLFVRLTSTGDGVVSGTQTYKLQFGNSGRLTATNVHLTLNVPSGLTGVTFGNNAPTSFANNIATWSIGTLAGRTIAQPYLITGTIRDTDALTATASITGTSSGGESASDDNSATETEHIVPLQPPFITSPRGTITGPKPAIRGYSYNFGYYFAPVGAQATQTVSVYLSGTQTTPSTLLGTTTVLSNGQWVLTPTTPISIGWHWITATVSTSSRTSPASETSFVVSNTLNIDPDSITRDGYPMGGLNAQVGWAPVHTYTIGMKIVACDTPLTPTLQALYFNAAGLMTSFKNFTATLAQPGTGVVQFKFTTPPAGVPFELYVDYYCPVLATTQVAVATPIRLSPAAASAGLSHLHDCFEALGCTDDPPDPPEPCTYYCIPKPHRPQATDPDGFVFDGEAVRAGATITQSIITNAWVTITQRTSAGTFVAWNGLVSSQANPQYTDSTYPDKVLIPGYYAYLVEPGDYRIQVTADGYLPYDSVILHVVDTPVTLNVPLNRLNGTLRTVNSTARVSVYMPLVER